ncbi:MAG: hypothetical protein ACPKOI_07555 [Pleomorphochaeta sp.]
MFESFYDVSIMAKGHAEEIARSCKSCKKNIKTTKKYQRLLNSVLISQINNFFNPSKTK